MNNENRLKYLSLVLRILAVLFVFGIYVMMEYVFTSGWSWEPRQPEYEQMIMGVYATLGVFLWLAARDPLANRSLIQFTAWSSLVHAIIMLVQGLRDSNETANLYGDVPALFLVAFVLWWLLPAQSKS